MPTLQGNRYETLGKFPKLKMTYEQIASDRNGDTYKCVLRYEGRQLTTSYSMGAGLRKNRPNKVDVIYCLLMDHMSATHYPNAREFADAFGYEDYREGETIFKGCVKSAKGVMNLLRNDLPIFQKTLENY